MLAASQTPELERPAGTGRDGASAGAIKPGKNSKATSEAVAAELKRARAALDGKL